MCVFVYCDNDNDNDFFLFDRIIQIEIKIYK